MATITFDTLKFVEKLRAVGVSEAQAKVQAEVLVFALDEVMDQQLATKADIARLEREVKTDIARLEKSTQAEFKEVRADIAGLEKSTKSDISRLEREVKAEFKAEFKEVKADIAALDKSTKADIVVLQRDTYVIKWMMGIVIAGVMTLVLKTFFPG